MYYDADWKYLVEALQRGGFTGVDNIAVRASLQRLGYMVPAIARYRYWRGQLIPHAMALTKKGQKRAIEIRKQLEEKSA